MSAHSGDSHSLLMSPAACDATRAEHLGAAAEQKSASARRNTLVSARDTASVHYLGTTDTSSPSSSSLTTRTPAHPQTRRLATGGRHTSLRSVANIVYLPIHYFFYSFFALLDDGFHGTHSHARARSA